MHEDARFACYKLSKRFDQDISAVMGAFRCGFERGKVAEARIAFGGMAATPKRAAKAEAALAGSAFDAAAVERAVAALAEDFAPLDRHARERRLSAEGGAEPAAPLPSGERGGAQAGDARAGARLMDETFIQDRGGAGTRHVGAASTSRAHEDTISGGVRQRRHPRQRARGTSPARRSISTTCPSFPARCMSMSR